MSVQISGSTQARHPYADDGAERALRAYRNKTYRWFVLGLLTLVYVFNFVDRQVINILADHIIRDLGLSDTQFGALSGIAFAAIYCTLGIPIAQWADRGIRRNVVVVSLTVWSLMTAACGMAQNFWQLFMARFGVGVGEAGGSPPAHSMVSDIFQSGERGTALGIYSLGVYGGVLVGYVGGAYLVQWFNWRIAFVVVGLPGVALALLVRWLVHEPPRGFSEQRGDTAGTPFRQVMSLLWSRLAFRHVAVACALHAFVTYGLGNFIPLFLTRVHDMPTLDIGKWYGLVAGLAGLAGTLAGGWLSDMGARRSGDRRWYVWVPLISTLLAVPFALITFLVMPTGMSATLAWGVPVFMGGMYLGPCLALTHGMVGLRMRAQASAVLFFVLNFIGLGLGPLATGALSDWLTPIYGNDALRYAMSMGVLVNLWCASHYYWCSRHLIEALDGAPA